MRVKEQSVSVIFIIWSHFHLLLLPFYLFFIISLC